MVIAPRKLRATGQPSACVASTRCTLAWSSSRSLTPEYVTCMRVITSTFPSSSISPRAWPTRPVGSIPRAPRAPANVPVSQPPAAATT